MKHTQRFGIVGLILFINVSDPTLSRICQILRSNLGMSHLLQYCFAVWSWTAFSRIFQIVVQNHTVCILKLHTRRDTLLFIIITLLLSTALHACDILYAVILQLAGIVVLGLYIFIVSNNLVLKSIVMRNGVLGPLWPVRNRKAVRHSKGIQYDQ
jgi:hypothetical protein